MKITNVKVEKKEYNFEGNKGFNYSLILTVEGYPLPLTIKVGKVDENTRNILALLVK